MKTTLQALVSMATEICNRVSVNDPVDAVNRASILWDMSNPDDVVSSEDIENAIVEIYRRMSGRN